MERETVNKKELDSKLQGIVQDIQTLAEENRHDALLLLALLRQLEQVHRQIRTEMFETSLPETRNNLYQFVKDIEEKGGWPYIERMKLAKLLQNLELQIESENS